MEPQSELSNPPQPDQTGPVAESLRSYMASKHYWLVALLPLAGMAMVYPFLPPEAVIPVGWVVSFAVNIFVPLATNFTRALYVNFPALLFSIVAVPVYIVWELGKDTHAKYYLSLIIPGAVVVLLIVYAGLVFLGMLGAKVGLRRGVR